MLKALPLLVALIAVLPLASAQADVPYALAATEAANAYYRGDLEAAAEAYRAALRLRPRDPEALHNLSRVLRESGRMREALDCEEELLAVAPHDPMQRLEAAEVAPLAGLPEQALRYAASAEGSAGASTEALAGSLYIQALALAELGRSSDAAGCLERSLALEDYQPLGWLRLGLLRFERGELEQAETALRRALAQEPNLTAALHPLAGIARARGDLARTQALLARARASLPHDERVRASWESLIDEHPELAARASEDAAARRRAATPRRAVGLPSPASGVPRVRVGVLEGARELHLKAGGAFSLAAAEHELLQGQAGTLLRIRSEGGQIVVEAPEGTALLHSSGPVRLVYEDPLDTTLLFDVRFGEGTFWAGSEDRSYRGAIEVLPRSGGLTVVNILGVEEYLYSVVASEMPSHWPAAALQAQAVAARSYTLANLGRYAARGFDLLGSVFSAAYRGVGAETPTVRAAVDATRGVVLLDGEKPMAAYYSANSGGHTETTLAAWGIPSPIPAVADPLLERAGAPLPPADLALWLASSPRTYSSDPVYSSRSAYRWRLWVPAEEIAARVGSSGGAVGRVLAVRPAGRGASGRVSAVRIVGTAGERLVRWDALRWALGGLRSNLFVVEPKLGADGLPEGFVFTGAGWGHGVGLCQSGAAGMAASGWTAEQILAHYYGGASLRALY